MNKESKCDIEYKFTCDGIANCKGFEPRGNSCKFMMFSGDENICTSSCMHEEAVKMLLEYIAK